MAADTPPPTPVSISLVIFWEGKGFLGFGTSERAFSLQFDGYGISSVWVRLGWREKRTDLAWHIDLFLFFLPLCNTLSVSRMASSPRGDGPPAPRQ